MVLEKKSNNEKKTNDCEYFSLDITSGDWAPCQYKNYATGGARWGGVVEPREEWSWGVEQGGEGISPLLR